jgi:hypothetical protein
MLPIPALDKEVQKLGGLKVGVTRNANGEAIQYYAGSQPPPKFLMNIDSLLNGICLEKFEGRNEDTSYFYSYDWDTTKAGFVDIVRPKRDPVTGGDLEGKETVRYYFTTHQPTNLSVTDTWFRKIEVTFYNTIVTTLWEEFKLKGDT